MQPSSKIVNTPSEHYAVCKVFRDKSYIFPGRILPFSVVADVIL